VRARALAFAAIAALCSAAGFAPNVFAQQADEPLLATASEWGGQGGVYTCAQWRAYVTRMYRLGDPRKRGYIEAKDFEIIRRRARCSRWPPSITSTWPARAASRKKNSSNSRARSSPASTEDTPAA